MKELEVKEVSEVIATLEVIDDTLAGDVSGRTNVVNFDNFVNFERSDNFKIPNSDNFFNFDNFKKNSNMKKEYMKPTMKVVQLQHRTMLLQASRASTNLAPEDDLKIEDTPSSIWGR